MLARAIDCGVMKLDKYVFEDFEPERLVKSSQRVKDLAEVFTPGKIVDDMLDLIPRDVWQIHPSKTFLEPSVGNGNFVSAILSRKLTFLDEQHAAGALPAGKSIQSAQFHALEALSSIYGVDISEDNIIGGTPGHEVACRPRLLTIVQRWHDKNFGSEKTDFGGFLKSAQWIVNHNLIIGNMLEFDSAGNPTNRDNISIFEYEWKPKEFKVSISRTTLGAILAAEEQDISGFSDLFAVQSAEVEWNGNPLSMHEARSNAVVTLSGSNETNSRG